MAKYCCFFCPNKDYSEKALSDFCPNCGKPYGYPLTNHPSSIGEYLVTEARGRGFYAATYLCHRGKLKRPYILKVSPVSIYKFFGKHFETECQIHLEVARGTEHIVPINDYFDTSINFGDNTIDCFVAVIDFIEGIPLNKYIESPNPISARSAAQIAIDLFRIWREFINKQRYHNDLHADNIIIQKLHEDARRAEAIDENLRAVAIDLGSVGDASKSDACDLRLGDQHWLCRHLQRLVDKLQESYRNIDNVDDLENRISEAMERTVSFLLPSANAGRVPTADQLIRIVRDNFFRSSSPWKDPLRLDRFDDSYNAGALEPWYVPFLLVDPDDSWIKRISAAGPLLITGMRGCGKTMLLRAMDFHARAAVGNGEDVSNVINRINNDNYVGLFISCMNLLTIPGRSETPAPLERLFCAYCIETIRAVRHLQEIDRSVVVPNYHENIAEALATNTEITFENKAWHTDYDLERFLLKTNSSLKNPDHICSLKTSPAHAFVALGHAVKSCTPLWNNARVFFLLDDVSTRYLKEDLIRTIFSALLFQSPVGAFKLTTEAQTLEMALYSPGLVEKARVGRDYDVFDLGAEVYEKTKSKPKGKKLFIEEILERRAHYYPNHPKDSPRDILGDCSLEDIARNIATTSENSRDRKAAYTGISALSAVCVGDIGDVISIYELILRKASGESYPVKPEIQSECYQSFCSRRLYDLNRRESDLKDFALTFAEASYELLLKSSQNISQTRRKRLRQYASIYVRVTAGDTRKQFQRLRELIDAGVYVLHGGTPRTKTRDGDPIQQFKLTYRKLFGLSNFIGLSESDRFELSGERLEEWLMHPEKGKDILLKNLGGGISPQPDQIDQPDKQSDEAVDCKKPQIFRQASLFDTPQPIIGEVFKDGDQVICSTLDIQNERLSIENVDDSNMKSIEIDVIILGLGFEDRSIKSTKRLLKYIKPNKAILIEYKLLGKSDEIERIVRKHIKEVQKIKYEDILLYGLNVPKLPTLIDVSALAKPALFSAVRNTLLEQGYVWICHTLAQEYYPLNTDIERVIAAEQDRNQYELLEALSQIFTGEKGPYSIDGLIESDVDESRRKVLCTFSSAKHQRLLTLLDMRDYDRIEIIVPPIGTPRSEIAYIAAEIAGWNFRASGTNEIHTNDLRGTVDLLVNQYKHWYVDRGYNLEIGLTGSKMQAVAAAVVSVVCKIAHCWYVSPQEFDPKRFTRGIGESRYFKIKRIKKQ
jgi:serine/threonine protein kinase